MKYLIRADSSLDIGAGHLMRCLALGQMLHDHHQKVIFVTQTDNEFLLDKLKKEHFEIIKIPKNLPIMSDANKTVEIAKENDISWVITDGYKFHTEYQKKVKDNQFKLFCIDDLANYHFVSDIVLNQNYNADKIFKYSCEPYTKLFLGSKHVLLRREFRIQIIRKGKRKINCQNILITLGGSDEYNNTLKILQIISSFKDYKLNIKILCGVHFRHEKQVNKFIRKSNHKITLLINEQNVVPVMQWSDLAISPASSTALELLYLQKKVVLIAMADNQKPILNQLKSLSWITSLGWHEEIDNKSAAEVIANAIRNNKNAKIHRNFIDLFKIKYILN